MIIHFICRGNSFRSIIAEAYLNSCKIPTATALSSGTVAAVDKEQNLPYYRMTLDLLDAHGIREFAKPGFGDQLTQARLEQADITVCLNQRGYDECLALVAFPVSPQVWSVADVGEPGRIAHTESENRRYREEAYQEIVMNVDRPISRMPAKRLVRRPHLVILLVLTLVMGASGLVAGGGGAIVTRAGGPGPGAGRRTR